MNVKTFTASTIQEALATAREKLGDEVVLLESHAASHREPARVTVMMDAPEQQPTRLQRSQGRSSNGRSSSRQNGRQQHQYAQTGVAERTEETARTREGFSTASGGSGTRRQRRYQSIQDLVGTGNGQQASRTSKESQNSRQEAEGRGRLFPTSGESADTPEVADPSARAAHLLEKQLTLLHDRMDRMERRLGEALVGTAQQWAAHPLFAELLERGLRPATAARLFESLVEAGYEPDRTENDTLRWHLAQELRRKIDIPCPKNSSGTLLFVGPSGGGKSTLILKLARNRNFFGRRNTAVISLLPKNEDEMFYRNPADLCRQCGLSAQTVRTREEMNRALERVAHFDQVLIDTPPIPMQPHASGRALKHIRRLIEPVVPLESHLVMNTTRSFEGFDAGQIEDMPLNIDCLALTHLDEAVRWGRTAEWIQTLSLPVRFASTGREMPEGVVSFSPSWFIEEMMDLN